LSIGSMQAILKENLGEQAFHEKLEAALRADVVSVGDADARSVVTHIAPTKKRQSKIPLYIAALVAIVAVVVGGLFMVEDDFLPTVTKPADNIDTIAPVPGFSGRSAIAVLPFVNRSNDREQDYFADGITEDLITGLQAFQSFPIIAASSTFKYKGTSPDVREVAVELGAGYIIDGSVRKIAEDVHITVKLNNAQGQLVWAENYDFKYEDVLRMQAELVSKIMLAIEPELLISEVDRARFVRTEDMEAFDYFLRASANTYAPFGYTDLNGQAVTPERLDLAREYALKSVELDPKFAAGWRMLNHIDGGYALNLPYLLTEQERMAKIVRSIEYGERSRQLSPFEPTVCSCLATMLLVNGQVEQARLLQEESLKQNPGNAGVHAVMAKILQVDGDPERALEEITLAIRLSPKDMAMSTYLYYEAAIYQELGRFDEAVASAKKALLLAPINYDAEFVKIVSLFASGQRELAQAALFMLKASTPDNFQTKSAYDQEFAKSVADKLLIVGKRYLPARTTLQRRLTSDI
ncbi:MAG: tetratricopeptide repeat protein, partial [Gammaproteobacteria bacterium]|nr:tetratricopeptide repeat protein [Gammaproteobacteria bacterium]